MPLATRGRLRNLDRAVKLNDNLYYGFKTVDLSSVDGITSADITALGQVDPSTIQTLIVYSPQSPKPAQFRKRLINKAQGSVTAYGDGSSAGAVNTAAGKGWQQTKGIRGCSFGGTSRSASIAVRTENGLLVKYLVPLGDAGNASALGWETTLTPADRKKLVYAPKGRVALVSKASGTSVITLPCSFNKVETATSPDGGWNLTRPESGFAAVAVPAP